MPGWRRTYGGAVDKPACAPGLASAFTKPLETDAKAGKAPAWIYAGYKMTVISNDEEEAAKPMLKGGTMKFTPQTALQRAGGVYSSAANCQSKVVLRLSGVAAQTPWAGKD